MWTQSKGVIHVCPKCDESHFGNRRCPLWVILSTMGTTGTARERSDWSDAVAAQIRAERAAAGKTQAQVYETAGISRSAYLRIEKGTRVVDVSQLARICAVLNLGLSTFFERVEDRLGH